MFFIDHVAASVLSTVHLTPRPWPQPSFLGQQLKDVVVEGHFVEYDFFPAERAGRTSLHPVKAMYAHCVVHSADDDRHVLRPVVTLQADIAPADIPEPFLHVTIHPCCNSTR